MMKGMERIDKEDKKTVGIDKEDKKTIGIDKEKV